MCMLKAPKAASMVSFPFYLAKWHPIKQQKLMLWNTELIGITTTIKLATLNQYSFSRSPNLSFNNINFIMSSTKVALRYLVPCLLFDCAAIDFSGSQVMLAFPKMSLLISQPKREQTSFSAGVFYFPAVANAKYALHQPRKRNTAHSLLNCQVLLVFTEELALSCTIRGKF